MTMSFHKRYCFSLLIGLALPCFSTSAPNTWEDTWTNTKEWFSSRFSRSKDEPMQEKRLKFSAIPAGSAGRTLHLKNKSGAIAIVSDPKVTDVIVNGAKRGRKELKSATSVFAEEKGGSCTIETRFEDESEPAQIIYHVTVPLHTAVYIDQEEGPVSVANIGKGDIVVKNNVGNVSVIGAERSVTIYARGGKVDLTQRSLPADTSIFIEANRCINLAIPKKTRAEFNAKTLAGEITTDLYVTLSPATLKLNKEAKKNYFKQIRGARIGSTKFSEPLNTSIFLDAGDNISIKKFAEEPTAEK